MFHLTTASATVSKAPIVFDGSASNLLMHALATKKGTSAEELSQIRGILNDFEAESEKGRK